MAIITWQTGAGNLGSYPAGSNIAIQLLALSDDPSSIVSYKIISGEVPLETSTNPITLSLPGYLSGVLYDVGVAKTYTFTVRAYDQYGNVRDRTFSMSVTIASVPQLTTPYKLFSTYDSVWVDYILPFDSGIDSNIVSVTCSSGDLPAGLYVQDNRIKGYAEPSFNTSGTPINKTFIFTLQMISSLGNDSKQCAIEVLNQRIIRPPHSRIPAICNSKPPNIVEDLDPFYSYYLNSSNDIPQATANEYFTFKVLGKDFDNDVLRYSFGPLPEGLVGDSETGWITGTPIMNSTGVNDFIISVSVSKLDRPLITSPAEQFQLRVLNGITDDIEWVTPEDLGIIYNHTVSELFVSATSSMSLVYSFSEGNLPANLELDINGNLTGRVAFQPSDTRLLIGDETEFTFTVQVFPEQYPKLRKYRTFTLKVKQIFDDPVETVYFKSSPGIAERNIIKSLLTDQTLIPDEYLYRPNDIYFGKASDVTAVQAYGIPAASLQSYLAAIQLNHYQRNLSFGPLKTAIARDDTGHILYEVVYSEVVDELINENNVSIPESINWPRKISLNLGAWTVNNSNIYASYAFSNQYYTSLSPGSVKTLYPASVDNMRTRLIANLGQNTDSALLPKWMTSQQRNGNTLGFIRCWVLCYTLPNYSEVVKENIETNWEYDMTDLSMTIDRYLVDKSATFNWNLDLAIPAWNELPSEVIDHTNMNKHDMSVIFERKTILPK